jgi:hypothetical protein
MFYCEGKYCSRRAECAHNKLDTSGKLQQWLDMSTEGRGWGGIDDNGKPFCNHEYECGDLAPRYNRFEPITLQEG